MNFLTKKGVGKIFTYEEFYTETGLMFGYARVWISFAINDGLIEKTKNGDYKVLRLEASLEKWK